MVFESMLLWMRSTLQHDRKLCSRTVKKRVSTAGAATPDGFKSRVLVLERPRVLVAMQEDGTMLCTRPAPFSAAVSSRYTSKKPDGNIA